MGHLRHFLRATALVFITLWLSAASAQTLPRPLIPVAKGEQAIQLVSASVKSEVMGSLATSHVELVFLNPNARVLEGELQFPLREGQSITGFALESLNGGMMQAAPVEKAKGQQVFEEITRRNVDPALLEQTQGNNFRLRIYPLAPGKPRTVSLDITETLSPAKDGSVTWQPPLAFGKAAKLEVAVSIRGLNPDQLHPGKAFRKARLLSAQGDAKLLLEEKDYQSGGDTTLSWKLPVRETVFVSRFEGERYFSAELPFDASAAPRAFPRRVVIVWDASGSGANRDHGAEFKLLDGWFKTAPKDTAIKVALQVVRDQMEAPKDYEVKNGDWSALRTTLENTAYDGASGAWQIPAGIPAEGSLALLFSDGLTNWGEEAAAPSPIPLYSINAAPSSNALRLRGLAESSQGRYLDLATVSIAEAVKELNLRRGRVNALSGQGAEQLVSESLYPQSGRLRLAGRLTQDTADIAVTLETPSGKRQTRTLHVNATKLDDSSDFAARRWGRLKITQLEEAPNLHSAEILRLGSRFGLVSSRTSLIVLESLADYLRYQVLPPAGSLRTQYLERQAQQSLDSPARRSRHLDELAQRFAEKQKWWEKDFPKGAPPPPPEVQKTDGAIRDRQANDAMRESSARMVGAAAPMAMPAEARPAPAPMAASAKKAESQEAPVASIQLQKWQPDAAYARRLREAKPADRYAIYLDEKPGHANSTAFFMDAADVFFEKGETELAVRILSNLKEMDLENRHILRILAYRLEQAGQVPLALPLLKRVRELAPEEPQSWRDLGLAEAEAGLNQAALDDLWETVGRPWDGRFADIDLIALAELNALAARTPGLDLSRVDSRLRRNLPLDLRAVLAWDADNTDIDLWVIDPNGEKAYYGHQLTYQGGRMSRDFTAGYGPEEFSLKTAKPGRYEVRAQFYGHRQQMISPYTTLMLKLSTGFGTSGQKDESVTLRLSGKKEEVLVGTFEVGAKP
jgi:tetratricopeptide (TPR) repeat protein